MVSFMDFVVSFLSVCWMSGTTLLAFPCSDGIVDFFSQNHLSVFLIQSYILYAFPTSVILYIGFLNLLPCSFICNVLIVRILHILDSYMSHASLLSVILHISLLDLLSCSLICNVLSAHIPLYTI